jgi:hypothetical protein
MYVCMYVCIGRTIKFHQTQLKQFITERTQERFIIQDQDQMVALETPLK